MEGNQAGAMIRIDKVGIIEYKGFGTVGKYQEGMNVPEVSRSRPLCWRAWSMKGSIRIRRLDVKYTRMGVINC